jgi:hypothetical protein
MAWRRALLWYLASLVVSVLAGVVFLSWAFPPGGDPATVGRGHPVWLVASAALFALGGLCAWRGHALSGARDEPTLPPQFR